MSAILKGAGKGAWGILTTETAHIQHHVGLFLDCYPLELGRGEGAGNATALLLSSPHGLHEAVLTYSLETLGPIIRHKPEVKESEVG